MGPMKQERAPRYGDRAVLFGMDEKRDSHVHPWDMLRVGLKVRTADGQMLDVERRKGKGSKSLLFAESGKPVPLEAWTRVLPVSDAELFETMFGLDYESLVVGGRQLAEFKGDIGQAILAASGDLGQTARRVQELRTLAQEIYTPQASSKKLNKALREYRDADAEMRRERFTSAKYKEAVARGTTLDHELEKIADELARCSEEQNRLTRLQTAAPHVQRLREDQNELDSLSTVVALVPDFEQRFNKAMGQRGLAYARKETAQAELERLGREAANIPRDSRLASVLNQIEPLAGDSGKIKASREQLPKREATLEQYLREQERLCSELGVRPGSVPRLTLEHRKRMETLSTQYVALTVKQQELPGRIATLQSRVRETEMELAGLPPDCDTTDLSEQLAQIPAKKWSGAETTRFRQQRDDLHSRIQRELQTLPLWNGTAEQLETARLPLSASVNSMATRFTMQQNREARLAEDELKLRSEITSCANRLAFLEQQGAILTDEDLTKARTNRDLGWAAIKDRWLNGKQDGTAEVAFLSVTSLSLPQAFEIAIREVDSVADQLRREANRVEQKRSALADQQQANQRLSSYQQEIDVARQERQSLETEWTALWSDAAVMPRTPHEMLNWLDKRNKLIEQLRDLQRATAQIAEADRDEEQWRKALSTALEASPDQPLAELVTKAKQRVSDYSAIRQKRTDLLAIQRNAQVNFEAEVHNQDANEQRLKQWSEQWKAALREAQLSETADAGTAQALIATIDSFWTNSDAITELRHRIDTMREDETTYAEAVRAIAQRTGRPDIAETDALTAVKDLQILARTAYENGEAGKRNEAEQARNS